MANIFTRILDKLRGRNASPALQKAVATALAPAIPNVTKLRQEIDVGLATLREEIAADLRKKVLGLEAEVALEAGKSLDVLLTENDPVRKQIEQTFVDSPALPWLLDGEWVSVNSSNVDRIRYFFHDRDLDVEFRSGSLYSYHEVPPEIAAGMYLSNSKGRYVWSWLRDVYPFTRLRRGTIRVGRYPKAKTMVRALNKEEIAELGVEAVRSRNLELIRKKLKL